jgi:hypothetical protein
MLKIEVECMEDVLMAAIRDYCAEKLAGLKCPHHNCEVTLVLTNGPVEISVSNIQEHWKTRNRPQLELKKVERTWLNMHIQHEGKIPILQ